MMKQLDLLNTQAEIGRWMRKNFGEVDSAVQLCVIQEELGELAHSFVKNKQQIRRYENHREKMKDAVADIVLALCGFCECEDISLNLEECIKKILPEVLARDWKKNTGCAACDRGNFQLGHADGCPEKVHNTTEEIAK